MPEAILDKVRSLASEIFDVPASAITADSSPGTLENWDSVAQLNLMLALEQEFGVRFEPEDLEKFQSIGHVAAAVQEKAGPR